MTLLVALAHDCSKEAVAEESMRQTHENTKEIDSGGYDSSGDR